MVVNLTMYLIILRKMALVYNLIILMKLQKEHVENNYGVKDLIK